MTTTGTAALLLDVPRTSLQRVLKKHLNCFGYKLQLRHEIKPTDKPKRFKFAVNMQVRGGNLATATGLGCCYTRPPRFQFTEALTFCLVVTTFIRFMEFLHGLGK